MIIKLSTAHNISATNFYKINFERRNEMATNNNSGSKRIMVPSARHALNQMKLEIASELGMTNYDTMDKGTLTSRENGYVGGNITRNLVEMAQASLGDGTGKVQSSVTPEKGSSGVNNFK